MIVRVQNDIEVEIAIIGSGPCGLGAAWKIEALRKHSDFRSLNYVVLDRNSRVGGWASSISTPEGFTFDYGNHVLFPHKHYQPFVDFINSAVDQWVESIPIRGIWAFGKMVPYPIQRNLQRLPLSKMVLCLSGVAHKKFRDAYEKHGDKRPAALCGVPRDSIRRASCPSYIDAAQL